MQTDSLREDHDASKNRFFPPPLISLIYLLDTELVMLTNVKPQHSSTSYNLVESNICCLGCCMGVCAV